MNALGHMVEDRSKGGPSLGPMFWCVACQCGHGGFAGWTWDGNEEAPTITPSYAVWDTHGTRLDERILSAREWVDLVAAVSEGADQLSLTDLELRRMELARIHGG